MTGPLSSFVLEGKVALVTGGSRGLGRATVLGLAGAGADVIVTSRKFDACEEIAERVRVTTGRRALAYACHIGHWDEIEGLVEAAYDTFGRVDILVNNAGMSPLYESVVGITEKLYDSVMGVNLKGPFRLSALVGARMVAGRGGSIINVSSGVAVHPDANTIPYGAAKAGLNHMTQSLALAFGPRVRVNSIMPGRFLTDVSKAWDFEEMAASVSRYALGRFGEPEEIVGTVLYLASDAAAYTTGAVIAVDGGIPF
jgi:NAD(P)-dependent dehydrogenase (short-subunit alcohol dehydrogenase family)